MTSNSDPAPGLPACVWLSLLAETSLHPGSGRELGVVDLPVAREGGTGYPVLFGSQLKGSLKDRATQVGWERADLNRVFGEQEAAGAFLISDARVVLLPVRSLTSSYRWLTCPHVLERLRRDLARVGKTPDLPERLSVRPRKALSNRPATGEYLYLEEREAQVSGPVPEGLVLALATLMGDSPAASRLADQVTVVDDDTFAWFTRYGLPVRARNKLVEYKQSGALWYEESLPPDTLLVAVLGARSQENPTGELSRIFAESRHLQVGGNETVGEGWVSVSWAGHPRPGNTSEGT